MNKCVKLTAHDKNEEYRAKKKKNFVSERKRKIQKLGNEIKL